MGAFADSLFSVLMSWVRALVNGIWALFTSERTTLLEFLGKNWIAIAVLLVAAGLVIDWMIWLIRWQPYHIWAMRVRRILRMAPPEEEEYEEDGSAYMPPQRETAYEESAEDEQQEQWLPLAQPVIDEAQAQQVFEAAEQAPDERQYPGMRYDEARPAAQNGDGLSGTRRYAAVHAEGPGAAEVARRRAEIDAWQQQMEEEARQKAEAERAARLAEAERERKAAQEAYEAEQARLAQEAYEAEQARLAQEEYERQLAQYEQQKAQYERELAEYERQKAEYEAALAQQAQQQAMEAAVENPVPEIVPEAAQESAGARRRRRNATYSDYVEGEDVTQLPAAPDWQPVQPAAQGAPDAQENTEARKKSIWRSGMEKMAQMMEPEEEEIAGIASLPPRVDRHKAYKPAKKPAKKTEK